MVCASTLLYYFFDVFVTDFLALAKWSNGWLAHSYFGHWF
jgi:hypothetical protein